jgi:hypothetical protein
VALGSTIASSAGSSRSMLPTGRGETPIGSAPKDEIARDQHHAVSATYLKSFCIAINRE